MTSGFPRSMAIEWEMMKNRGGNHANGGIPHVHLFSDTPI